MGGIPKFRNADEVLEFIPAAEAAVLSALRDIILETIPDCREKISYNVPYYFRHSRICFLWPASVPWGNVKLRGVQLGFCNGNLLDNRTGYLDTGSRKQVFCRTFEKVSDIDSDLLRSFLFEAVEVDERLFAK